MKKLLSVLAVLFLLCACSGQRTPRSQTTCHVMIAYFSATGNTEEAAKLLAQTTGAEMVEILPAESYSQADLDWRDSTSRSTLEMQDPQCRPALAHPVGDVSDVDVIYLGYPIWWDQAPRIIQTWLDGVDLQGKTIIPFCTSGSSTIANSQRLLRQAYPQARWLPGRRLTDMSEFDIEAWVTGDDLEEEEE